MTEIQCRMAALSRLRWLEAILLEIQQADPPEQKRQWYDSCIIDPCWDELATSHAGIGFLGRGPTGLHSLGHRRHRPRVLDSP